MSRLLFASSLVSAPHIAAAVGQFMTGCARAAIVTTAEPKLKERGRPALLAHSALALPGGPALEFFDLDQRPSEELAGFDLIFFADGNPFYLLKRARETEADSVLEELVAAGRPIAGIGASAAVLGRSLRPLRMFDASAPDFGWKDLEALGAVPFAVLPHANRWRSRFSNYDDRIATARAAGRCEITELSDDDGVWVENGVATAITELKFDGKDESAEAALAAVEVEAPSLETHAHPVGPPENA